MTTAGSIITVTTLEEAHAIKSDWDQLSGSADHSNVFMTYEWFTAWAKEFIKAHREGLFQPLVLVLRQNGSITGIAPFVRRITTRYGFRVRKIEFVASFADYYDFSLGSDTSSMIEGVAEFLAQTKAEWDCVDLRALRVTAKDLLQIEGALRRAGLSQFNLPEAQRCPFIPIDGPWSQLLRRRSGSTREALRRKQSRLEEMIGDGLRIRISDSPQEEPELLERMIAIEAQKQVGGKLSAPFLGRYSDVFSSLFETLGPKGWLNIALIELGDQMLAWNLVFRCGRSLWSYQHAYNHDFSHLSPGTMLLPALIDYGFANGCTEYDFLYGEEPYKLKWAKDFHQTSRLLIWNRQWRSRLLAYAFRELSVFPNHSRTKEEVLGRTDLA